MATYSAVRIRFRILFYIKTIKARKIKKNQFKLRNFI